MTEEVSIEKNTDDINKKDKKSGKKKEAGKKQTEKKKKSIKPETKEQYVQMLDEICNLEAYKDTHVTKMLKLLTVSSHSLTKEELETLTNKLNRLPQDIRARLKYGLKMETLIRKMKSKLPYIIYPKINLKIRIELPDTIEKFNHDECYEWLKESYQAMLETKGDDLDVPEPLAYVLNAAYLITELNTQKNPENFGEIFIGLLYFLEKFSSTKNNKKANNSSNKNIQNNILKTLKSLLIDKVDIKSIQRFSNLLHPLEKRNIDLGREIIKSRSKLQQEEFELKNERIKNSTLSREIIEIKNELSKTNEHLNQLTRELEVERNRNEQKEVLQAVTAKSEKDGAMSTLKSGITFEIKEMQEVISSMPESEDKEMLQYFVKNINQRITKGG